MTNGLIASTVKEIDIKIQKVSFRNPLEYFRNISGRFIVLNIIMNIELNIPTHAYNGANGTSLAMLISYTSLMYIAKGAVDNNIITGWVDSTANAIPPIAWEIMVFFTLKKPIMINEFKH